MESKGGGYIFRNFAPRFATILSTSWARTMSRRRLPKIPSPGYAKWYDYSAPADGPASVQRTLEVARASTTFQDNETIHKLSSAIPALRFLVAVTAAAVCPFADVDKKDEHLALRESLGNNHRAISSPRTVFILRLRIFKTQSTTQMHASFPSLTIDFLFEYLTTYSQKTIYYKIPLN